MSNWFITDDDCIQCCRPVPADQPDCYEFAQICAYPGFCDGNTPFWQTAHGTIYIHDDYSAEEILSVLQLYGYRDMDDFVQQNTPKTDLACPANIALNRQGEMPQHINYQLISEMFFETEIQEYVENEYTSWNDAVLRISEITGLNLQAYLEKPVSLDERIQAAKEHPSPPKASGHHANDSHIL